MEKNTQKITKAFCKGKVLGFLPETVEEAALIQRKFLEMGYEWDAPEIPEAELLKKCVSQGMVIDNKKIHCELNEQDESGLTGCILCTSDQFDDYWTINYLAERVQELSAKELPALFAVLQQKFPKDFAAAANPAALTRDIIATSPPVIRQKPPSQE